MSLAQSIKHLQQNFDDSFFLNQSHESWFENGGATKSTFDFGKDPNDEHISEFNGIKIGSIFYFANTSTTRYNNTSITMFSNNQIDIGITYINLQTLDKCHIHNRNKIFFLCHDIIKRFNCCDTMLNVSLLSKNIQLEPCWFLCIKV